MSAVGFLGTDAGPGYTQAKAPTLQNSSGSTATSRAFLDAAIAVAEVRVRHAVDQADHYDAMRELVIEKLGYESVRESMEIALIAPVPAKRMFRYFCGVCWKRIRSRN